MAKDKPGFQIFLVPYVFRVICSLRQTDICKFLRGFRTLEIKCDIRRLLVFRMASELEITQEKVLETIHKYVLKIVLLLVGQMSHGLLKCYLSN